MKKTIQLITSLICFAFCGTSVQATTNYWDINGATAGAGGATPAGTWDTGTTANWSTDSAGGMATTTWADNDDAIFSAGSDASGSFTIDLSGTPVVGNLTVEEGAITISGGTALNVGGGVALKGVIDVFADSTLTISSVVTGGDNTGSITKGLDLGTGTGTLVLSGQNTYNGQTTVRVGTLSYDSIGNVNGGASALGNPTNAALGTLKLGNQYIPATLRYTGTGHTTDRVINLAGTTIGGSATNEASGSGPIIFNSSVISTGNGIKVFALAGTNTGDNTISGSIGEFSTSKYTRVEKHGPGTWVLSGTSSYYGVTDIRDGTLTVTSLANGGSPSSIGTGSAGSAHLVIGLGGFGSTNATLRYIGTGSSCNRIFTLWGTDRPGGGTIDASGTGPLVLSGAINHPPQTEFYDKVLNLKGTNTGMNTIGGQISDGVGGFKTSVRKMGVGTWVLSGPNTYSGDTTISEGSLLLGAAGVIPDGTGKGNVTVTGTLDMRTFSETINGLSGGGTIDTSNGGTPTLTVGAKDQTSTFSGTIVNSLGSLALTKTGTGTLTLTGVNTYTGNTTVSAGKLALSGSGSIAGSPNIIVGTAVGSAAILDVSGVAGGFTLGSSQTLKGHGTVNGAVTANGTLSPGTSIGTLTLNNNLTLLGNLFIEVNKSLSPSNDTVTVAGTLTNAGIGTVTVTNIGANALAVGDSFQIFNKGVSNGLALTVVSAGSVIWTNKLAVDGSIAVVSTGAPTPVPATNLTIVAAGLTSFSLGGLGAANSAYGVYASTNVTTPMTNWWLIGTTNSNGGGVIQFLDSQATNAQRFYRFGQ